MLRVIVKVVRWFAPVAMVPVVARDHRPADTMAWLAFILFLPFLGIPLYFVFGEFRLRRSVRRHTKVQQELDRERILHGNGRFASPPVPSSIAPLRTLMERLAGNELGGLPTFGGNRAELLVGVEEPVDRLVADIDAARHHVHLLFYVFNGDRTGWRVGEALARAAGRGVACRVLVDSIGSKVMANPSFFAELGPWLQERGVRVESTLPLRLIRRPLARIDLRNHRKIAVVDGRIGYVGSLNLHDDDFGLDEGVWHQATVRLEGPTVSELQLVFIEDWHLAEGRILDGPALFPEHEGAGEVVADVVPGGPTYRADLIQHSFIGVINLARERLVITTPYFVPDEPVRVAVRLAALRGVRVDLIVPRRSDERLADLAACNAFANLLQAGVKVHRLGSGVLHAKTMTADDDVAVVGSANLDWRSLFLNYEVNLVVYDGAFVRSLRAWQEDLMEDVETLPRDWWSTLSWRHRLTARVAELAMPVL